MLSEAKKEKLFLWADILHRRFFGVEMSFETKKFIGNLSWAFLGGIIAAIFLFLVNIFGARWLGPSEYGKFQFIFTLAQFFVIPIILGLSTSSTKYISETENAQEKEDIKNTVVTAVLSASIIVSTILFLSYSLLLKFNIFDLEKNLVEVAIFLAVALGLYQLSRSLLQGYGKIKEMAYLDVGTSFLLVVIFGFTLTQKGEYFSLFIAFLFSYLLYALITFFLLKVKLKFNYKIFKRSMQYGFFAILGSVTGFFLTSIDKIFIQHYQGSETLGLYSAYLLASSVLFLQLVQIFITVFFPAASANKNKRQLLENLNRFTILLFGFSTITSFFTVLVVIFLLGKDYNFNIVYAFIFSINVGIMILYQLRMWLLNSEGLRGVRSTVIGLGLSGLLNIVVSYVFVPRIDIFGALLATFSSSVFFYYYLDLQLKRVLYGSENK